MGLINLGHTVLGVDVDEKKLEKLRRKEAPLYEKDLQEMLTAAERRFEATNDIRRIAETDVTFICVGTPSKNGGEINLDMLMKAAESVGNALGDKMEYHLIVIKSTVLPGTTELRVAPILEAASQRRVGPQLGICANPEFLREGTAIHDFLNPDIVVIGESDKKAGDLLAEVYKGFNVFRTTPSTAEMIKYTLNAALATKISFINEIGNICKLLGIDVNDVALALGKDKRISPLFLKAGAGWGGSCFGKDISALIYHAHRMDYKPHLLEAVKHTNSRQPHRLLLILQQKIKQFDGKKVAVLGLAFKAGTDDTRDSPALVLIDRLLFMGAKPCVYDPKAKNGPFKDYVGYVDSAAEALKDADAAVIVTDWPEFANLDYSQMKQKIVVDGRNIVKNREGIDYEGICW
jgi:UDPglucose 6-dehydrogenase